MITEEIREALLAEIVENSNSASRALRNGDIEFLAKMRSQNAGLLRAIEILDEIVRETPAHDFNINTNLN